MGVFVKDVLIAILLFALIVKGVPFLFGLLGIVVGGLVDFLVFIGIIVIAIYLIRRLPL